MTATQSLAILAVGILGWSTVGADDGQHAGQFHRILSPPVVVVPERLWYIVPTTDLMRRLHLRRIVDGFTLERATTTKMRRLARCGWDTTSALVTKWRWRLPQ